LPLADPVFSGINPGNYAYVVINRNTIKLNQAFLDSKHPKHEITSSHLNRSYGAFFLQPGAYTRPGSE